MMDLVLIISVPEITVCVLLFLRTFVIIVCICLEFAGSTITRSQATTEDVPTRYCSFSSVCVCPDTRVDGWI